MKKYLSLNILIISVLILGSLSLAGLSFYKAHDFHTQLKEITTKYVNTLGENQRLETRVQDYQRNEEKNQLLIKEKEDLVKESEESKKLLVEANKSKSDLENQNKSLLEEIKGKNDILTTLKKDPKISKKIKPLEEKVKVAKVIPPVSTTAKKYLKSDCYNYYNQWMESKCQSRADSKCSKEPLFCGKTQVIPVVVKDQKKYDCRVKEKSLGTFKLTEAEISQNCQKYPEK